MKNYILVCFLLVSIFYVQAQRRQVGNNRIGISGGYSLLSIRTSDFPVTPKGGWNVGFEQRGMLFDKSDLVYGMSFQQAGVTIPATYKTGGVKDVEYKMQYFQVYLLGSYRAISNHLNFDGGPVFQLNGKLKSDDKDATLTVINTSLPVQDLNTLSTLTVYMAGGVTGGFDKFRVSIYYHYGLNNIFTKANKSDAGVASGSNLKGNFDLITAKAILYL